MKKYLLIAFVFLLVGCDKNKTPEPDNGLGTPIFSAELFFGSWKLQKIGLESVSTWDSSTLTFRSDGKYFASGVFGTESGTFIFDSFDGWSVIYTNQRSEVKRLTVGSVKATELRFNSSDYEIGIGFELSRIQ